MTETNKPKFKFKTEYLLVAALLCVIVFVVVQTFGTKTDTAATGDGSYAYVSSLEAKLAKTVSAVEGVGKTTVAISVASGINTVIATETKSVGSGSAATVVTSPVLVGGKPIVLREDYPEVTGAVIVAAGADNLIIKVRILNAAITVLGISAEKIEILPG